MAKENNNNKNYFDSDKASKLCFDSVFGEHAEGSKRWIFQRYRPFKNYLRLAKETAQKKQNVEAAFKIIDTKKDYILDTWIEIEIISKKVNGLIVNDETEIQFASKYKLKVEEIGVENILINGEIKKHIVSNDKIFVKAKINDKIVLNNNPDIVFNKKEFVSECVLYHNQLIEVNGNIIKIDNYIDDICCDSKNNNIIYNLSSNDEKNQKNSIIIELNDDYKNEVSVYDVFFNEAAVDVYFTDKNKSHTILKKNKELGKLTIDISKGKNDINPEKTVHLKTDLSQIRKQENALSSIIDRPSSAQENLLNLCKDVDDRRSRLHPFEIENIDIDYKILVDDSREGTTAQRDFVKKALQTPDFMILQGPPGSGKTTAILELIYQLLKDGKKILLCASTHVAIDNVLERIIKDKNFNELQKLINPIRVGEEDNIYSECVKPYVYSNIMSSIPEDYRKITLESFNLVCGTTLGVQKFPLISNAIENSKSNSIEPIFDYMILDEASKTTFSEFLVPAVLCKKWIVVGDIKQLAPYVEKNDLVPSLQTCEPIDSPDKRIALGFLNFYYKQNNNGNSIVNSCFIMSSGAIEYVNKHLKAVSEDIVAITSNENLQKNSKMFVINQDDFKNKSYKLCALLSYKTVFLLEKELVKESLVYFSPLIAFYDFNEDISNDKFFNKYSIAHHKNAFGKNYREEYEKYSRKIEDEILWRLIRLYELNNSTEGKAKSYKKYIDEFANLLTEDERNKFNETIETLSNIAIPSIIKILQEGVSQTSKYSDILHKGFSNKEKLNRFVMLDFQHRMHPDISSMSREYVYDSQALKDSNKWHSKMNYMNSNCRFEIRDVRGIADRKNFNPDEVKEIINELKQFIEYAKNNPHEENKPYEIAILSFYNGQIFKLRQELNKLFNSTAKFNFKNQYVHVSLNTVDKFQGQEADIVYLSMVQTNKVGFLDSVNRVNVAITRAREKIIVFGHKEFFLKQEQSEFLRHIFERGENYGY